MARRKTHESSIVTDFLTFTSILTAADTYVDVSPTVITQFLASRHFDFQAATNDLHVQILGSLDGGVTFPITVVAEFTITAGTPIQKIITAGEYYTDLKVQVKPAVAATHGTLTGQFAGASN